MKKKRRYNKTFLTLDTETSHTDELSWVYQWAFYDGDKYISGAYPRDLVKALYNYTDGLEYTTICFVHNLSYDITFLLKFLREKFGKEKNLIALKSHKVLSITFGNIEFRCSYLLTQKKLDSLTKEYNVKHQKLTGTIDYSLLRYPDETRTKEDNMYMYNDVVGLHEVLQILIGEYNNEIRKLPLSKTGYVRQYCREQSKKDSKNREHFKKTALDYGQYLMVKQAFKGGYTHNNIDTRGILIEGDIRHFDFESHYPTVMMLEYFPMGKFIDIGVCDFKKLLEYDKTHKILLCIRVKYAHLKDDYYFSYIANQDCHFKFNLNDNGRVYDIDTPFNMCCTFEDLQIIIERYNIIYDILDVQISKKAKLPKFMLDSIKCFFKRKTDLKFEIKQEKDEGKLFDLQLEYMKSKGMLNSLYGMTATSPS